jgi:hypothetical protein
MLRNLTELPMKMSRLLLAILVVGCTPYQAPATMIYPPQRPVVDTHEASVLRLLAQERALRQEQQGDDVKRLDFDTCYRLLADVPTDAFSRGFLTPQEQFCYTAQELYY